MTVARGMGGEGSVANGHMTVGLWGKGGRGSRQEEMRRRGGRGGRGGGAGAGAGEEREGGPAGPPLWAHRAPHSRPIGPFTLGQSGPSSLGPFDQSSGPVRPIQHKARGLATGLKKKLKFGPLTVNGPIGLARTGPRA